MAEFNIIWRSVDDTGVFNALDDARIPFTRGGTTHPQSERHRFHLVVDAGTKEDALAFAKKVVESAGGDPADVESP